MTPGQDGAGVVDAVGDGVTHVAVGDRVWLVLAQHGRPYGTAADYTVQPAERVVPLPDEASYDLGASLGVPAVTAHRALTTVEGGPTRLGPGALAGRTVLVQGGAGAVGNAAIQLARWSGATVVTTVSSDEKAALATAAGAHHVVDYTQGDTEAAIRAVAPDGVDLVVEVAPAQNNELDIAVTKVHGTVAIYANNGGDELTVQLRLDLLQEPALPVPDPLHARPAPRCRPPSRTSPTAVRAGALRVGEEAGVPLHHFPLDQTAAAHDAVEGGAVGKVLIDISDG